MLLAKAVKEKIHEVLEYLVDEFPFYIITGILATIVTILAILALIAPFAASVFVFKLCMDAGSGIIFAAVAVWLVFVILTGIEMTIFDAINEGAE